MSAAAFCAVARALAGAAQARGLAAPSFKSPPRSPGVDRAVRRHADGSACVLVRRQGMAVADVVAAMVEGVLVVSGVGTAAADRLRPALMAAAWGALSAGEARLDVVAA